MAGVLPLALQEEQSLSSLQAEGHAATHVLVAVQMSVDWQFVTSSGEHATQAPSLHTWWLGITRRAVCARVAGESGIAFAVDRAGDAVGDAIAVHAAILAVVAGPSVGARPTGNATMLGLIADCPAFGAVGAIAIEIAIIEETDGVVGSGPGSRGSVRLAARARVLRWVHGQPVSEALSPPPQPTTMAPETPRRVNELRTTAFHVIPGYLHELACGGSPNQQVLFQAARGMRAGFGIAASRR